MAFRIDALADMGAFLNAVNLYCYQGGGQGLHQLLQDHGG